MVLYFGEESYPNIESYLAINKMHLFPQFRVSFIYLLSRRLSSLCSTVSFLLLFIHTDLLAGPRSVVKRVRIPYVELCVNNSHFCEVNIILTHAPKSVGTGESKTEKLTRSNWDL